jgi:hypothetical protein
MKTATSSALDRIVRRDFASQADFAVASGIDRTALNRDITGRSSSIPDDRLGCYLCALEPLSRIELLRGRLLDIVPQDLHESLVYSSTSVGTRDGDPNPDDYLLPSIPRRIPLTSEQRSALEWLATQLTEDSQLIEPVMTICERLGWERPKRRDSADPE